MIKRRITLTLEVNFDKKDIKDFGYNPENEENIDRFCEDGIRAIYFDRDLMLFDLFMSEASLEDIKIEKEGGKQDDNKINNLKKLQES
jgi:hypothetical protein